jgi:hypothetical protein
VKRFPSILWFSVISSIFGGPTLSADSIVNTDFGSNLAEVNPGATTGIRGFLPTTTEEDSSWADVDISYNVETDRLGSDLRWIRARLEQVRRGRAQLRWPLSEIREGDQFRLQTTLGSDTGSRVTFRILGAAPPFRNYWEQSIGLAAGRETRSFDFQLPAISEPVRLLLVMEQPGDYDLYSVQLIRRSPAEVEAEREQRLAKAPRNLAPNAGFALGLPSAWGVGRRVNFDADIDFRAARSPGPRGTVPLEIVVQRPGLSFDLYSAPFQVVDPEQIHVLSFVATGEMEGSVRLLSDGEESGAGTFTATPEGQLNRIPFRPDPLARWIVIHWQGEHSVQLDALNISMGRRALPFELPRSVEVALSASRRHANTFIEEVRPPEISFHLSGETNGADLVVTVTDLYGQSRYDKISLRGYTQGTFRPFFPDDKRPYGSFRLEAYAERDGVAVSPTTEVIFHHVPKPVYWGQIAPQSAFGNHFHPYIPHLFGAKAIGMNWNRFHGGNAENGPYWSVVEPRPGEWHWPDERMRLYREADFALTGVWVRAPNWARITRTGPGMNGWLDNWWQPRDLNEFAEYVRRSATHMAGMIDAWQIWNEPWGEFWFKEWRPELQGAERWHPGPTPEKDFVRLSEVAWEAFRSTGLDKPILGIGATVGERGKKWMEDMLELGAERFSNTLSFHAYFGGNLSLGLNPRTNLRINLENRIFRPVRETESARSKPIWMTEGGWLERSANTGLHYHSVPGPKDPLEVVRESAAKLPLYHALMFANGVEKVFTYALNGGPPFYRPYPQGRIDWSSLVTQAGELHVSATAFAAMAQWMEGATFLEENQLEEQTVAFVFRHRDGYRFEARFGMNLNRFLTPEVRAYDFLGNPARRDITNHILYLPLED